MKTESSETAGTSISAKTNAEEDSAESTCRSLVAELRIKLREVTEITQVADQHQRQNTAQLRELKRWVHQREALDRDSADVRSLLERQAAIILKMEDELTLRTWEMRVMRESVQELSRSLQRAAKPSLSLILARAMLIRLAIVRTHASQAFVSRVRRSRLCPLIKRVQGRVRRYFAYFQRLTSFG